MPAFDVTIQGKMYRVEIPDPGASPLQVIVDGQPFEVDVAGIESVARPAPPPVRPPRPAPEPSPLPPLPHVAVARPAEAATDEIQDVRAPMPGTILSVEVRLDQMVDAGQVVCILEAMKMKNPVRANAAGRVTEVAVQGGQTVAFGDLLVRLA